MKSSPQNIILFDGVCNLCHGVVNWVIANDPSMNFKFLPLQELDRIEELPDVSDVLLDKIKEAHNGQNQNDQSSDQDWHTVMLLEDGVLYEKSTAVLRICRRLSGLYPVLYTYVLIPKGLRDWIYDVVAENRYRWFGKKSQCMVPDTNQADRFI